MMCQQRFIIMESGKGVRRKQKEHNAIPIALKRAYREDENFDENVQIKHIEKCKTCKIIKRHKYDEHG